MNIFQRIGYRRASRALSLKNNKNLNLIGERINANKCTESADEDEDNNILKNNESALKIYRGITLFQTNPKFLSTKTFGEEIRRKKHIRFVITKNNIWKWYFDLWMDFLIWVSVFSSLYYLAYVQMTSSDEAFNIAIWIFFIIDFVLNFFSEITTKDNKRIMNLHIITRTYARGWMAFDILSLMPLNFVGYPNGELFLHLFRVFKMKRLSERINIYWVSQKFSDIFYKEETKAKKQLKLYVIHSWDLFKELAVMFFATYFLSCLWYYYSNYIAKKMKIEKSFYTYFELTKLTPKNQFIITWYYIFTTITTVGYGDYYATNKFEMIFAIVLLVMGPTWMAFTMGKAISIINDMRQLGRHEDKIGNLNIWLFSLEVKFREIPGTLKEKITNHFRNYWKNDRLGTLAKLSTHEHSDRKDDTDIFFNSLPNRFKNELIQYLFDDIFYKFKPFFDDFKEMKYNLALFLHPRIFMKNDTILEENEYVNEIYLKISGNIQIGNKIDNIFEEFATLKMNFIIGDYFAFKKIPSFAEFKAHTDIHGYALPVIALNEITKKHPEIIESAIQKNLACYQRIEQKSLETKNTKHLDSAEDTEKICLDKERHSIAIMQCVLSNEDIQSAEDPVYREIDKFAIGINKMKNLRKKYFSEIKEKLANVTKLLGTNKELG